jgi:uncharacterized protein YbjT (DUF2867 family)
VATQRPAKPCTPVRFWSAPLADRGSTSELIAVTGATGQVGGRVARRLSDRGIVQRLVVRDPARAPLVPEDGVIRGHDDAVYDVTAPEAFTLDEAAATMTELTGRPVRFEDETLEEAYASRSGYGAPDWEVEGWVTSYTAIAAGELDLVTDTVERLAGHPPVGLADHLTRG